MLFVIDNGTIRAAEGRRSPDLTIRGDFDHGWTSCATRPTASRCFWRTSIRPGGSRSLDAYKGSFQDNPTSQVHSQYRSRDLSRSRGPWHIRCNFIVTNDSRGRDHRRNRSRQKCDRHRATRIPLPSTAYRPPLALACGTAGECRARFRPGASTPILWGKTVLFRQYASWEKVPVQEAAVQAVLHPSIEAAPGRVCIRFRWG